MNNNNAFRIFIFAFITSVVFTLGGCAVIEGIFKAGIFVGILLVAAIIGLIIFIMRMFSKR